uniref:Delta-like protein n=1 Tax=Biomphalaria glabrata TaxID=6526 RepID=A0A2C9KE80_BIOGL
MSLLGRRKIVFACFLFVGCLQDVLGSGQIEVKFSSYSDSCREDWDTNKCDPKFSFCYGRPQNTPFTNGGCQYLLKGETGHWQDTNYIVFNSDMKGVPNPLIASINKFEDSSVTLAVKVRDDDIFEDDYLTTISASLSPVYRSKEESQWSSSLTMSQGNYRMTYQFRMFCDAYYYTTSCSVYCKQQDSSSGHYTCDPSTGAKLCMKGWKGPNCADDVNECEQGFCVRGECRNLPGDVLCICPANYTGKDCSELINPCKSSPCLNGGTCFAHSSQFTYICTCKDGWQGKNCESRVDPCSKSPCSNGGTCTSQPGATSYECLCREPYYGANCLQVLTTTSTTTTTTTTTTEAPSSSESMVADAHRLESQEEEGFQIWYIGIIAAAMLLACLVIVVFIIFRRRRHAKSQKEDLTCISPTGSNLVFENNMYNNLKFNQTSYICKIHKWVKTTNKCSINIGTKHYAEV